MSYCEFLFGKNLIYNVNTSIDHFKKISFLKKIKCEVKNPGNISGNIILQVKKTGNQNHVLKINFEKCSAIIENKSKDWTKNFKLKIYNKIKNKVSYERLSNKQKYLDGRSNQIHLLFAKFLKKSNYSHIIYCLNAEKIINKIN